MSSRSFVNAIIGLAREQKMLQRRYEKDVKAKGPRVFPSERSLGREVGDMLAESGYFRKAEAAVFGDALEGLLQLYAPKCGCK